MVSYCTMGLFYEHHGFFDWLSQSCAANGSESVSQTFPKCYSTHNDLVFQLKMPNSPIANLSFTRHVVMQKYIIHLNLTMSSLASFLFSAAGLVFLSVSGSWKLKYQCKKVSTRVGIGEKNQSMSFLRRTRLQKMGD